MLQTLPGKHLSKQLSFSFSLCVCVSGWTCKRENKWKTPCFFCVCFFLSVQLWVRTVCVHVGWWRIDTAWYWQNIQTHTSVHVGFEQSRVTLCVAARSQSQWVRFGSSGLQRAMPPLSSLSDFKIWRFWNLILGVLWSGLKWTLHLNGSDLKRTTAFSLDIGMKPWGGVMWISR